ncbi:alpha/beta fold hydrolase [Paucibacter sp. KCTC 42545]|uniref:alpha/beta fold hydrolase n=1 Tax=Paucibacter sp. KCTC 42545 TaxID=1768242 RepID=UPI000733B180|nr:alpha/beta hydrolase [Paucibacter sp. KCTC 42545]ALT77109.1 alpha/beta hydrolase [Paucibacter sp. KCTC 42545]
MKLSVNGHQAYAYTGGKPLDPSLPCVVFIHGALNDHSVWTLLARWFAHHGHSVLAVDLPGHGRSEGAVLNDIPALGAWVWQLLGAAGLSKAALVGHSMGSLIALEAAAQAPERCSQLAMLGTAYPMKVSEALLNTARDTPDRAIQMVNAFSFASWAAKPSYPGPGSWLQGGEIALKRRIQGKQTGVNLFEHDFRLCDAYAGGLEAAAKVQCPVSFILGERDQMTAPKQSQVLADALKAKVSRLPCGHSLMAEAPDALLAALRVALA